MLACSVCQLPFMHEHGTSSWGMHAFHCSHWEQPAVPAILNKPIFTAVLHCPLDVSRADTTQEGETFAAMYEGGGLVSNESTSASILAGATLGGGTRVNW